MRGIIGVRTALLARKPTPYSFSVLSSSIAVQVDKWSTLAEVRTLRCDGIRGNGLLGTCTRLIRHADNVKSGRKDTMRSGCGRTRYGRRHRQETGGFRHPMSVCRRHLSGNPGARLSSVPSKGKMVQCEVEGGLRGVDIGQHVYSFIFDGTCMVVPSVGCTATFRIRSDARNVDI